MSKKLVQRGRHLVLPIVGDTVRELKLGRLTTVVFSAESSVESELQIEEAITLIRGHHELTLEGSKPGGTWNPKALGPLLDLIGCRVVDALAEQEGLLRITFSNGLVMEIRPSTGYEAWHFHSPPITLRGAGGRLL
jgi:hypothetical protein